MLKTYFGTFYRPRGIFNAFGGSILKFNTCCLALLYCVMVRIAWNPDYSKKSPVESGGVKNQS